MQKTAVSIISAVLFLVLILVSAHSQEDMTHVDNSVFTNPQRVSAVFNHEAHNEAAEIYECNECHHVYEDGEKLEYESSEDMQCVECHEENASSGGAPALEKAYHLSCKGCHMERKKGPILCGECHVKR
jgi:hypothetical protein